MKKSQILAALALAFALGVAVIPSASTYATVVYPVGTTQTQIDAYNKTINADVNSALEAYGELDKVSEYTKLYNDIEAENAGLRDAIEGVVKTLLNNYNDDTVFTATAGTKAGINTTIEAIESVENGAVVTDASGATVGNLYAKKANGDYYYIKADSNLTQATLKDMKDLSRASSLKDAYSAVNTLLETAKQNKTILEKNYITPASGDIVDTAIKNLTTIISGCEAFMTAIQTAFSTTPLTTSPADYAAGDLKNVSEDAYDTLVDSAAWVDAANNAYTVNAVRYGLFMDAAAKLPKYNYVKQLNDAKVEFDKIKATDQAVDYDKAQQYISDFNTAIQNYKNGKAPSGTGEGTNKPGDDNTDPNAPDTGILADAEANASTTVAMVAGIATALTAAGAGVVAYRNARRSTRK